MYLLDTNIVSDFRKAKKGRTNKAFVQWANQLNTNDCFISVMTIFELEMGIAQLERRDQEQGAVLRAWFEDMVKPMFKGRILPITEEICIKSAQQHVPDPKSDRDAFIACTALCHGLRLVTRNVSDFELIVPNYLNPHDENQSY